MKPPASKLVPLGFGRISRVLAGVAVIGVALFANVFQISVLGFIALLLLGLSFVVGGLWAMPGCELAALPNLFLPERYRFTFP